MPVPASHSQPLDKLVTKRSRGKEKYDYIPSMIDSTVRNKNFTHATLCTGRHAFNKYLKSFETLELKICTTRKVNMAEYQKDLPSTLP